MPQTTSEASRKDLVTAIRFVQALGRLYPEDISESLLAALTAATEHGHLLDLLLHQLSQSK